MTTIRRQRLPAADVAAEILAAIVATAKRITVSLSTNVDIPSS